MPYGLFDYIDGSFHTMGKGPNVDCSNPGWGGAVDAGGNLVCPNLQVPPMPSPIKTPPIKTPGPSAPSSVVMCNPSSVGKRFSFNFPSGKKWTLSQKDDASAREFYCGTPGPVPPTPVTSPMPIDDSNIADLIYCNGGEGLYDGKPTFWKSSARKGCKTNNAGESKPYGFPISRDEYLQGMGMAPAPSMPMPPAPSMPMPSACPPLAQNEGLIQQAKMLGDGNALQVHYGSTNITGPEETFAQYKNCPIYQQLLSAYNKSYNETAQFLPKYYPAR